MPETRSRKGRSGSYWTIDLEKDIFYPGDEIRGSANLCLEEKIEISDVIFRIQCLEKTHWATSLKTTGEIHEYVNAHFSHHYSLFQQCFGQKAVRVGDLWTISPGTYPLTFTVALPAHLPHTFILDQNNYVRYTIKLSLRSPRKLASRVAELTKAVFVSSTPRVELPRGWDSPKTEVQSSAVPPGDSVKLSVTLPRRYFLAHEPIPLAYAVHNCSKKVIKELVLSVDRVVHLRTPSATRRLVQQVAKIRYKIRVPAQTLREGETALSVLEALAEGIPKPVGAEEVAGLQPMMQEAPTRALVRSAFWTTRGMKGDSLEPDPAAYLSVAFRIRLMAVIPRRKNPKVKIALAFLQARVEADRSRPESAAEGSSRPSREPSSGGGPDPFEIPDRSRSDLLDDFE